MTKEILIYLSKLLGKENSLKYMEVEETKINAIMNVLTNKELLDILTKEELEAFIYKLAFGTYGVVFTNTICQLSKLKTAENNNTAYKTLINIYIFTGFNDKKTYKELFEELKRITKYSRIQLNFSKIEKMVSKEIEKETSKTKRISKLLKEKISYDGLINLIEYNGITNFDTNTKLHCPNKTTTMKNNKLEISFQKLSFLISRLEIFKQIDEIEATQSTPKLSIEVEEELLEAYQIALEKYEKNNFNNVYVSIEDKQNLVEYLIENKIIFIEDTREYYEEKNSLIKNLKK